MIAAIVWWEDSAAYVFNEWHSDKDDLSPIPMITVGNLVRQDEKAVVLATDYCPSPDRENTPYRGIMVIPRCNITKIRIIKERKSWFLGGLNV